MLYTFDKVSAQALAKKLSKQLASSTEFSEAKLTQVQHALARVLGYKDWNALNADLALPHFDEHLNDVELSHIENNAHAAYGAEYALKAHTGFELRYSADPRECAPTYVRVCDPYGREIAYWVSDEWGEDPELVMGAILGVLVRGQPLLRNQPDAKPKAKETGIPQPRLAEMPFERVHAVKVNGQIYRNVFWTRDLGDLRVALRSGISLDYLEQEDTALSLVDRDEEGLEWSEDLTMGTLLSLKWNATKHCFECEGYEVTFYLESIFGQTDSD